MGSVQGEVAEATSKSRTWKSACSVQAAPHTVLGDLVKLILVGGCFSGGVLP